MLSRNNRPFLDTNMWYKEIVRDAKKHIRGLWNDKIALASLQFSTFDNRSLLANSNG